MTVEYGTCRRRSARRTLLTTILILTIAGCGRLGDHGPTSADTATVRPEQVTTREADEIQRMAACLAERGVATTIEADGTGFSADPGALSQQQFRAIIQECKDLTGAGSTSVVQLSPDEIRAVYERWVETAACLRRQGYETDEPSSVQTFIDAWATGDAWNPYLSIRTDSTEEFARLNRLCPQ